MINKIKEVFDNQEIKSMDDDIYKQNILDHFKNPQNLGKIEDAEINSKEFNPVCGDQVEISVKLENSKVKDAKFRGQGCAISMASSSMLTEKLKGMSLEEVKQLTKEDITEMLGINLGIVRLKCGMLSLSAIKKGIKQMEESK